MSRRQGPPRRIAGCIGAVLLGVVFGRRGTNNEFKPQNEFKLDTWISLQIGSVDLTINKAVLYLFLAAAVTTITMVYVANRMQDKPNRIQTAVESAYQLMRTTSPGATWTARWRPAGSRSSGRCSCSSGSRT